MLVPTLAQGSFNTLMGYQAGNSITSGSSNTMIGKFAGSINAIGVNNTFLGKDAGFTNIGSGNIFLGHQAGFFETGSNRLYIDNSNTSTPLIWGDFQNDKLKVYGLLAVGDSYTFPAVDGQYGQFLRTDGFGQLSWADLPTPIVSGMQDNDGDTRIEVEDSPDEDVIRFKVAGTEVMSHDGFGLWLNDVIIGAAAGQNLDGPLSSWNTMVGVQAGGNILYGDSWNTAIGYQALENANGEFGNTAVGLQSREV